MALLGYHLLNRFDENSGKSVRGFTPGAMDAMLRYSWPGNVRELENAVERAVVLLVGELVCERELPPQRLAQHRRGEEENMHSGFTPGTTLREMERAVILKTLEETGNNKSETAKLLGINRKTLHLKLQKYELEDKG